jgi:hypothetical protein
MYNILLVFFTCISDFFDLQFLITPIVIFTVPNYQPIYKEAILPNYQPINKEAILPNYQPINKEAILPNYQPISTHARLL